MKKIVFLILFLFIVNCYSQEVKRNFFEFKSAGEYTDNIRVTDLFRNNKDCIYQFDASYIYKNFTDIAWELEDDYHYYILKDVKCFSYNGYKCYGIVFPEPYNIIIIADNQEQWLDTNFTMSDKYLIHEIAHALTWIEYGEVSEHDEDWKHSVKEILEYMEIYENKLYRDIIKGYE